MKAQSFSPRALILATIIPVICLVPFITKAFHIDDPLFLWCAKQIQTHPFDFYGFTANWYGQQQPMFLINQNPPLISYYISVVASFFGWGEITLHIAFLIPAVCLSIGIYFLACFFCPLPHIAALIAVLSPVFLVSSSNIMCDTLMLSFYVWAIFLWLYGIEKDKSLYLLCASILISLSSLTKYFGISLIPLLLFYTLVKKRKLGAWSIFFSIPIGVLLGYHFLTLVLYGNSLLLNAATLAINPDFADKTPSIIKRTLTGLSFTGGCMAGILFYTHLLWSRRALFGGAIIFLMLTAALVCMNAESIITTPNISTIPYYLIIQYSIFITIGGQILLLSVADLLTYKDAKSMLLFLWVFGTFVFASYLNWTINARTVLPMIPAVGIIVIRRIQTKTGLKNSLKSFKYIWPLIPAALIALSATWADVTLANSQRTAAREITSEFNNYPHTIWFQGHWGFQYYMQSIGAKPLDYKNSLIKDGDIVVVPLNNYSLNLPNKKFYLTGKTAICAMQMGRHHVQKYFIRFLFRYFRASSLFIWQCHAGRVFDLFSENFNKVMTRINI